MRYELTRDIPVKAREKVLSKPDMDLEALTKLVAEFEAMELINASLRAKQPKTPKPVKAKEEAMPAAEKERKKRDGEKESKPRKKLPHEAYKVCCWCFGGQHSRSECKADKSAWCVSSAAYKIARKPPSA